MTRPDYKIKKYYELAKPGIIYGNLLTAVAGFLFASGLKHFFNVESFFALVFGTAFVIGSACVFNNYIDREIDIKMERTKHRALVQGTVSPNAALNYANILGIAGVLILIFYTNTLTTCLEVFGLFSYVVLYGLAKRRTSYGVIVGSLPGAMPVVAGYCAVTDHFDLAALILFVVLVLWQMPHFYGIALYRAKEYRAAGIPVLPLQKGIRRTKIEMLLYTAGFFVAVLLLTVFGYTGYIYCAVMAVVAAIWIWLSIRGFSIKETDPGGANAIAKWGRTMFLFSLIVIVIFSVMISVGAIVS